MATAVILAGGKSRRMGRDKLELELHGQTMLESAVNRFMDEFDEVYISVADEKKYPDVQSRRIVDILPGSGPISGLHAALKHLNGDGVFLVAADLPYSCPRAAKRIIELCDEKEACVVKFPDGRLEPLFGYYRNSLLGPCEELIASGEFRMSELLARADTRYATPGEIGDLWDESMMLNINYPEDYEKLAVTE